MTFTKTPPTEPGWYWCKHLASEACALRDDLGWWFVGERARVALPPGTEFGPAIPSPEAIEAAKAALRKLTHPEAVTTYEGGIDATIHTSEDTVNEARAALAKLEGRCSVDDLDEARALLAEWKEGA